MPQQGPDSKALQAAARHGDVDAFAQLFEEHRPTLHRVAYRLVGADDCDDVVMETYLKAWQALPRFRGGSSLRTWLCRIAHNCGLDLLRRERRRHAGQVTDNNPESEPLLNRIPDERSPAPDREAALHDLGELLRRTMQELSPAHRTVLQLREVDGLSYLEIAATTGVSLGTVMSRLFHARRSLRRKLEASERCDG